jgi:pimeloyl-ACP methyl ester carboxylesterase
VVLGHSLGALVAIWLARFGPLCGRIAHGILLDPPLVPDLSVPGQGELLFDLGLNLGAQTPVESPVLPTAEQLRAYGLASFGAERYFQSQGPAGSCSQAGENMSRRDGGGHVAADRGEAPVHQDCFVVGLGGCARRPGR